MSFLFNEQNTNGFCSKHTLSCKFTICLYTKPNNDNQFLIFSCNISLLKTKFCVTAHYCLLDVGFACVAIDQSTDCNQLRNVSVLTLKKVFANN